MQLRLRHAVWAIIILAFAAGCSQQPVSAQPDSLWLPLMCKKQ